MKKLFAWVSILSLVLQISGGIFIYRPVFAEEVNPELVEGPTPETTVTEQVTPTPGTPAEQDLASPDNTPTVEPTPTIEIILTETPTEPLADPTIAVNQPEGTISPEGGLNLDPSGTDATSGQLNSELFTDKNDYSPSDIVSIAGSGFIPNTEYEIVITSETGNFRFSDTVTSDESGGLFYSYQLDGTYRPNYLVEVTDLGGIVVASTTFTDTDTFCQNDVEGANDEPGQKDLTRMCYTPDTSTLATNWQWDEINWTGGNTGDACNLFDTDNDGKINFSLCVTVSGAPASIQTTTLYSCGDAKTDRCTNPISVISHSSSTSCNTTTVNTDPFSAGANYPQDTQGSCSILLSDIGSVSTTKLVDVCSYPSQEPNSDPSDCIIATQAQTAKLEVVKKLVPSNDTGLYDLSIDGSVLTTGVGDGGTTHEQVVLASGGSGTPHTFSEAGNSGTNLENYITSVECRDNNGTGNIISTSGSNPWTINIVKDKDIVCTITNTLQQGKLKIIKNTTGGNDTFNFSITGPSSSTPSIPTSGGTGNTGFLSVNSGTYAASETIPSGWHLSTASCVNAAGAPIGTFSTNAVSNVIVGPNDEITCTFNDVKKGSITACKYNDHNGNGTLDSNDDQPLSGWDMTLNPGNITQPTGTNGCTTFSNLLPNNYSVTETLENDWSNTSGGLIQNVTLGAGENPTITFLNFQCATISGMKWEDLNGNGIKDGQETGAGGWTINLDKATNNVDSEITASDGTYSFKVCEAGDYIVSEELLTNAWYQTYPGGASPNHSVSVTSGGVYTGKDFGNARYAKIFGYKYRDNDGDGILDANDLTDTLAGWIFDLYDGATNVILQTFNATLANGYFEFTGLKIDKTYYVLERLLPGWIQTFGPTPTPTPFSLQSGEQKQIDFANFQEGKITVCKYNDINGNGSLDNNEPEIDGVAVHIEHLLPGGQLNNLTLNGVTGEGDNPNGCYIFDGLEAGDYKISETVPSGFYQTYPNSPNYFTRTVLSGSDINVYFLNTEYRTISGTKYQDLNNNGQRDAGEPGLENWTIFIDSNNNGTLNPGEPSVTTDANGDYEFTGLVSDSYMIAEVLQLGWVQTQPTAGHYDVDVHTDVTSTDNDFGNFQPGSIGDFVWEDLNNDTVQDAGEPGIGGVTVNLYLDDGDGIFEPGVDDVLIGTEVTDGAGGAYLFENLVAGHYWVDIDDATIPVGFTLTTANDPLLVDLDPGENEDGADFGYLPQPPSISIAKKNDHSGGGSPGDTVKYTLTLTNGPVPLLVDVIDVMPSGFVYVAGSGVPSDPNNISGNVLTWNDVYLAANGTAEITYQAKIDGSQPAGTYYNLATCHGSTLGRVDGIHVTNFEVVTNFEERPADCEIVDSSVPVGVGVSTTTAIGGTVLGISTVLGAATGSETYWLVLALMMILAGVSLMILIDKKKRALLLKKLTKISKKLSAFSFFVFLVACFFIFAGGARANDSLFVRVADLPEYKNTDNFKLYYTALEREEKPISVDCYVEKDGGFGWKTFGGTQTEPSGSCEVFGYELEGDATYRFKAIATSVDGSTESNITQTKIDRSGPEAPKDYRKSRESSTSYKIHWKNPGNDDYALTRIFASTEQNFTADDATKKADVGGGKDVEFDYVVTGLEPNQDYYFALQGFDKAGNQSGLAGDGGTVTYEVTPAPTQAVAGAGEVVTLPEEEGTGTGGEILGGATEAPTPTEAPVSEGVVAGITSQVGGMNKGLLATGAGILIILAGLGYYFYRKQTS